METSKTLSTLALCTDEDFDFVFISSDFAFLKNDSTFSYFFPIYK